MTKKEMEALAVILANELETRNCACPLSDLNEEQATALKNVANGYIQSSKAIWETARKFIGWGFWALIGYGALYWLTELIQRLKK